MSNNKGDEQVVVTMRLGSRMHWKVGYQGKYATTFDSIFMLEKIPKIGEVLRQAFGWMRCNIITYSCIIQECTGPMM